MKDVSTSATPAQPGNIHNVVHNATGNFYSSIINIVTYMIFSPLHIWYE